MFIFAPIMPWESGVRQVLCTRLSVMAGQSRLKDGVASARLCPAIHVFSPTSKTWMPGTSPGVTEELDYTRFIDTETFGPFLMV